jgi:hypothetical protein
MEATDVEVDNEVMVVVVADVDMDVAKLEVVMLGVVVPGAVEEAVHISTMMHDIGAARHPTSRCSSLT